MHRHMIKMNLTMRESYISPEAALLDCDYGQALCVSTGDFSDGQTIIW